MSVEYKAILCYGIELTHKKELSYIEKVGEQRWEEIRDDFFIVADGMTGVESYGILGVEIASAADGEYVSLASGHNPIPSIPNAHYKKFRRAMFEVGEFEARPQFWMICQVN